MPLRIEAALFFYKFFLEVLMKKYRFLKWFVLFVAIGSVLCFFIPFTDPLRYHNHQLPDNLYYFKNPFTPNGTPLGIEFVIGRAAISNSVLTAAIWLSRVSFAVALAAIVFAVLSLTMKDVNGLNKQGKFHKSLIISPILAFSSALINFITIQVGSTIECTIQVEKYEWTDKGYGFAGFNYYRYYAFTGNYTWIGLVIIGLLLIPVVILAISAKKEMATAEAAPQAETVSPIASSNASSQIARVNAGTVSSQTAVPSGAHKTQKNYMEDKPMTKKDAEAILAYIWVRQYNNLPFDEALDKIMAYLIENKYVITPETAAELSKSVSADEDVSGDIPAANDKDLRHAREARDSGNWEDAKKYYERVRDEYPDFLEARFYYPFCKLMDTMNKDFFHVYTTEFSKQILPLVKNIPQENISVEEQKRLALVILRDLCKLINRAKDVAQVMNDTQGVHIDYRWVTNNMYELGIAFEKAYADNTELLKAVALVAFKAALGKIDKVKAYKKDHIDYYVAGIQRYEPNFEYPKLHLVANPFSFKDTTIELFKDL